MTPELEVAQQLLVEAKRAGDQTDRAIKQTETVIAIAREAMAECKRWQERALAAEAKLKSITQ